MAGKHLADPPLVWFGRLPQKVRDGTEDAWSAEPALQRMMLHEGTLHLIERPRWREAFRRYDIGAVCLRSVLRAAADCSSLNQNCTSSAYAMLAADVNREGMQFMT